MNADDVVICIDPFESEYDKLDEVLLKGVGLKVFAISSRVTPFPTIPSPRHGRSGLVTSIWPRAGTSWWTVGLALGIQSG